MLTRGEKQSPIALAIFNKLIEPKLRSTGPGMHEQACTRPRSGVHESTRAHGVLVHRWCKRVVQAGGYRSGYTSHRNARDNSA